MEFIVGGALIVGLTLGLLGSGGSAIAIPILVYLVGHDAKVAIAESMAIVAIISVVAAIPYALAKQIDWASVLYFGAPGMLGTFLGATIGGFTAAQIQLIVFGAVLLTAAIAMLRHRQQNAEEQPDASADKPQQTSKTKIWKLAIQGLFVGMVTGFVGVGGGFLIVPALAILGKLPMRQAIGTSLVVIIANSSIGFFRYQGDLAARNLEIEWNTVLIFGAVGIVASFLGKFINSRLNQQLLRKVFAVFLILLGAFIIFDQSSKLIREMRLETASISIGISAEFEPIR